MKVNLRFVPPPVKMMSIFIVSSILLNISSLSFADKWTQKASMFAKRSQFASCVFNNEIYVFGAADGGSNTAEKYNPTTDMWKKITDMPHSRQGCSAVEVNGKIYVIGTIQNKNIPVDVYDPIADTWESKSEMPNTRGNAGVVAIGDKVYIIGGATVVGGEDYFSNVDVYDIKKDTWEKNTPLPIPIEAGSACTINGKIYFIGGWSPQGSDLNSVWEFLPDDGKWTKKTDMPTKRVEISVSAIDGNIFAIGGIQFDISINALTTYNIYDPIKDTWDSTKSIPYQIASYQSAVIGGSIYIIGGLPKFDHGQAMNSLYQFVPFDQPTTSVSPEESLIGTWGKIKAGK